MAGIGFQLRDLAQRDNLSGLFRAYAHSALASTGPWLFTVIALGSIITLANGVVHSGALRDFKVIIIYNFAFSLVMSAPLFMVATRFMADCLHKRDVSPVPGMLLGALALLYATQLPFVALFYWKVVQLDTPMRLLGVINFLFISSIWLLGVFVTAVKDYKSVSRAFALGMLTAVAACRALAAGYAAQGMLAGFTLGLAVIIALLLARILTEYPFPVRRPFAVLGYFPRYWHIAAGGFLYNLAVWVDKWIMWFAPEAEITASGLPIYPNYDSAMFLAYLTIVPAMAMFLFSVETNFYEHYLRFYRDIQNKVPFRKITKNHHALARCIIGSASNFLLLQCIISLLVILAAPRILDAIGGNFLQIGMFRFGVLGALCHVLTLFLLVLLSYFDNRRATFHIQALFLAANAGFTLLTLWLGFPYYGSGYFLAALATFLLAAVVTGRYLADLPFHSFITTNTSVRGRV